MRFYGVCGGRTQSAFDGKRGITWCRCGQSIPGQRSVGDEGAEGKHRALSAPYPGFPACCNPISALLYVPSPEEHIPQIPYDQILPWYNVVFRPRST